MPVVPGLALSAVPAVMAMRVTGVMTRRGVPAAAIGVAAVMGGVAAAAVGVTARERHGQAGHQDEAQHVLSRCHHEGPPVRDGRARPRGAADGHYGGWKPNVSASLPPPGTEPGGGGIYELSV